MHKIRKVEFAALDYTVYIVITDDYKKTKERLRLHSTGRQIDEGVLAFTFNACNNTESFIFLKPDAPVSVIAHEAWHVVFKMLSARDIKVSKETEEVVAYHLDYLVSKTCKVMRKGK
jgi:hypothetical protein